MLIDVFIVHKDIKTILYIQFMYKSILHKF